MIKAQIYFLRVIFFILFSYFIGLICQKIFQFTTRLVCHFQRKLMPQFSFPFHLHWITFVCIKSPLTYKWFGVYMYCYFLIDTTRTTQGSRIHQPKIPICYDKNPKIFSSHNSFYFSFSFYWCSLPNNFPFTLWDKFSEN